MQFTAIVDENMHLIVPNEVIEALGLEPGMTLKVEILEVSDPHS
jgi:bifunctional DNA-binding transcriptional regulator/antitoxin component of YhaV-PrlF toxin-antitoxin module